MKETRGQSGQGETLSFIDLFCGIGGFRIAAENVCAANGLKPKCVFSSEIDPEAQKAYQANFGDLPHGDITRIDAKEIPDHDILFAGFPCQPFSICGDRKGFDEARGTLFFDIARILAEKKPKAFLLENVKMLAGHDGGRTISVIMRTLEELGYTAEFRVLNALNFGLPQKRERVFIVGFKEPLRIDWNFEPKSMKPLSEILEKNVPEFYFASPKIRMNRLERFKKSLPKFDTVWHENKAGDISAHPFSCALRAGASYNYLLVNGERRLTEREMLRLQGFPESYKVVCSYSETRKQAGNSVAIPCIEGVLSLMLKCLIENPNSPKIKKNAVQQKFAFSLNNEASNGQEQECSISV